MSQRVIDQDELVEQVTGVLPDVNAAELRAKLKAGRRFVRIRRELTPKQQEEIYELGLPGLDFIEEYRRVYPMGATASHVVIAVTASRRIFLRLHNQGNASSGIVSSGPQ